MNLNTECKLFKDTGTFNKIRNDYNISKIFYWMPCNNTYMGNMSNMQKGQ